MSISRIIKKPLAVLCAVSMLAASLYLAPAKADAAFDTASWVSSIAIDFGTTTSALATNILLPATIPETEDVMPAPVQGTGTMLFSNMTVSTLLNADTVGVDQRVGFDKIMPSAVSKTGGNYFTDYVFSPNGAAYSFSIDLVPGQYYVYVYTGNKTAQKRNTTFVSFGDEGTAGIVYDQSSNGGSQFWGATQKELVYVVDVVNEGYGYGTLAVNLFDDKLNDEAYASSHEVTIDNATEGETGVSEIDDYGGTSYAVALDGSDIITARLNGIEISPVKTPVHSTKFTAPATLTYEASQTNIAYSVDTGSANTTDRIYYYSTNPAVATVDYYSGAVTPKQIGKTDIKAYNAYTRETVSTELNIIADRTIKLDKSNAKLILGGSEDDAKTTLKATFNNPGTEDVVNWSSSNPEVIAIGTPKYTPGSTEGTSEVTITALKAGSAIITATRKDNGEKVASCSVSAIKPVASVAINDKDNNPISNDMKLELNKGDTYEVNVVVLPEDATDKSVKYSSSDDSVATVSESLNGATITAVGAGEAFITATSVDNPEASSSIAVKVTAPATEKPADKPADGSQTNTQTGTNTNNQTVTPTGNQSGKLEVEATPTISLSGKAKTKVKVGKKAVFKAALTGANLSKVSYKIKKGKKFVKVTAKKNKVTIKAKKRGTAKIVITVKTDSGSSKKFTRTIKIK